MSGRIADPSGTVPAGGRVERVIALIDHRPCTTVAIQAAARLVPPATGRLEVVAVRTHRSWLRTLAALESLALDALIALDDHTDRVLFGAAAAALAPSGLSWDFRSVPSGSPLAAGWRPDGRPTVLVVARHPTRLFPPPLVAMARRGQRALPADLRLWVTGCAHRPGVRAGSAAAARHR